MISHPLSDFRRSYYMESAPQNIQGEGKEKPQPTPEKWT